MTADATMITVDLDGARERSPSCFSIRTQQANWQSNLVPKQGGQWCHGSSDVQTLYVLDKHGAGPVTGLHPDFAARRKQAHPYSNSSQRSNRLEDPSREFLPLSQRVSLLSPRVSFCQSPADVASIFTQPELLVALPEVKPGQTKRVRCLSTFPGVLMAHRPTPIAGLTKAE